MPSGVPQNLTAQNRTNINRIKVSWQPVPVKYQHGNVTKYQVTFQAVIIGDLVVEGQPVKQKEIESAATSITIDNLEPYVVYRIGVAAKTRKGLGPAAITYGGRHSSRISLLCERNKGTLAEPHLESCCALQISQDETESKIILD